MDPSEWETKSEPTLQELWDLRSGCFFPTTTPAESRGSGSSLVQKLNRPNEMEKSNGPDAE